MGKGIVTFTGYYTANNNIHKGEEKRLKAKIDTVDGASAVV